MGERGTTVRLFLRPQLLKARTVGIIYHECFGIILIMHLTDFGADWKGFQLSYLSDPHKIYGLAWTGIGAYWK